MHRAHDPALTSRLRQGPPTPLPESTPQNGIYIYIYLIILYICIYRVIPLAGIETKDQNVCDAPRCRMVSRPCRTDLSSSGRSVGHVERSCPAQSLRSVRSFSTLMSMGQVDRTFEVSGSCRSISHIGQVGSVGQVSHIGQFPQVGRSCRSDY